MPTFAEALSALDDSHDDEIDALRDEVKEWKERCCLLQERLEAIQAVTDPTESTHPIDYDDEEEIEAAMNARKKRKREKEAKALAIK